VKRFAFLLVLVGASSFASADIMLTLFSGPVTNGANFNWTYTAILKSGSTLATGDYFTINDIGGFGPGVPIGNPVIMPGSGWTSSIQLLGINGFATSPADNGSVYNVTYTYTGTPLVAGGIDLTLGAAGAFGYTSSLNTSVTSAWSATSHASAGGALQGNTSTVTVAGAVPEPASLGALAMGAICLIRKKARKDRG
jgi:hypothetical protein